MPVRRGRADVGLGSTSTALVVWGCPTQTLFQGLGQPPGVKDNWTDAL